MRLIDANELMQTLGITNMDCDKCAWYKKEWGCCARGGDFEDACYAIENAPTAAECKTGRWEVLDECSNEGIYCSECHKKVFKIDYSNTMKWKNFRFCPNCGAKMEEVNE